MTEYSNTVADEMRRITDDAANQAVRAIVGERPPRTIEDAAKIMARLVGEFQTIATAILAIERRIKPPGEASLMRHALRIGLDKIADYVESEGKP